MKRKWSLLHSCSLALSAGLSQKKTIEKKPLCRHDKNYYQFWKLNIPVINLIVGSRNIIKVPKNMFVKNLINNESRFQQILTIS